MTPLKRLLAATDLSAPARHAVERAALVARAAGARLDVVHVTDALSRLDELQRLLGDVPADLVERVRQETELPLTALAGMVRGRYGVGVATHVVDKALLAGIEETAAQVDADLLVLGARGSSTLRRMVLGSTAARLVSRIDRPQLVVKRMPVTDYRRVLVPVDFSAASLPSLHLARMVAPGALFVLMHAYEAPFEGKLWMAGVEPQYIGEYRRRARAEAEDRMASLAVSAGLPPAATATVLVHGSAAQRILEQEDEMDCDLVVAGRQGQNRVEDMLLGSVTRRLLADAEADVLVLP
ncbi:universal stress protein [Ramlibacter sp. G-1-2-2]|uniref:Universal stress protein n=1 Tax=Ramlibacter agri TaxID=2728837 RepID=A0A848H9P9_9BURK|nr:universal stress protein [Ramlibacter agri]NML47736.1 universal stress protein [Ramlibacter agri]